MLSFTSISSINAGDWRIHDFYPESNGQFNPNDRGFLRILPSENMSSASLIGYKKNEEEEKDYDYSKFLSYIQVSDESFSHTRWGSVGLLSNNHDTQIIYRVPLIEFSFEEKDDKKSPAEEAWEFFLKETNPKENLGETEKNAKDNLEGALKDLDLTSNDLDLVLKEFYDEIDEEEDEKDEENLKKSVVLSFQNKE